MRLCLQPYDLIVKYVPGKFMYVADTLSRAFLLTASPNNCTADVNEKFDYVVHAVVKNLPITTSKLDEIKEATACDDTMQTVI